MTDGATPDPTRSQGAIDRASAARYKAALDVLHAEYLNVHDELARCRNSLARSKARAQALTQELANLDHNRATALAPRLAELQLEEGNGPTLPPQGTEDESKRAGRYTHFVGILEEMKLPVLTYEEFNRWATGGDLPQSLLTPEPSSSPQQSSAAEGPERKEAANPIPPSLPVSAELDPPRTAPDQPRTCICSGRNKICSLRCLKRRQLECTQEPLPEMGLWGCPRCSIVCSSGLELEAHFLGKRHRQVQSGQRWWCAVCEFWVDSHYQEHVVGKRHRYALNPF